MNKKVKIGIIGTGVGLRTHYPGFKKTNCVEFIGLSGSSLERAIEFSKKYEFEKVFSSAEELINCSDIDLVCITSPNNYHFKEIMLALDNKKSILAEKPLVSNKNELFQILSHPNINCCLNLIDHQLRLNPYIRKIKELISQGQIGRPYFVKMHQQSIGFSDRNAKWMWSFDEKKGGGVRLAMASHFIDLINYWFEGIQPLVVKGSMDSVIEKRKDLLGRDREIYACSFFSSDISFYNNMNIQLSATAAAFGKPAFDFSIYGTDGELHFDLNSKITGSFAKNRGIIDEVEVIGVTEDERANKVSIFSGSFVYFAEKITNHLLNNDPTALEGAAVFKDALYTQLILDAILKSAINGKSVKLNDGYTCNSKV